LRSVAGSFRRWRFSKRLPDSPTGRVIEERTFACRTCEHDGDTAVRSAAQVAADVRLRAMAPQPFSIDVSQAVLDDLKRRLDSTRWPEPIPGVGWEYGADVASVRELCDYWRTSYDWRTHEEELNRYPQFLCEVDGVDLQFWRVLGKGPNPFPLLLIHGWPGSMVEFQRLVGPLTDPASHGGDPADAFDVVVPSLPGFGWSGKPRERGWGISRIAAAFDTLMSRALGYGRYGVQGGDWGGIIAAKMGSAHADHVSAIHLNFVIGAPPAEMSEADKAFAAKRTAFRDQETGYSNVRGTKPDSLTVGQTDSPAGLAAWVTEKFRAWSDCGGNVESAFSKVLRYDRGLFQPTGRTISKGFLEFGGSLRPL